MEVKPDQELVERVQRGDRQAYEILVVRYYRRVFALCLGMLMNVHDAQDVCQETLIRGYLKIRDIRETERFGSWLFQIARNAVCDFLRQRKIRRRALAGTTPPSLEKQEDYSHLTEALTQLPMECRVPLMMYYFDGKNARAIAEHLEISHSTVCGRLREARRTLYTILSKQDKQNEESM